MSYTASVISIVMLLIAIPVGLPYGYYVLLRWIICASAAYLAYLSLEQKKEVFTWLFGLTALIFNPIIPLHLGKDLWVIIDFLAALLFGVSLFAIKKQSC